MIDRRGILIIDDDPAVQRVVASALAGDYTVHAASSGEDGLAELAGWLTGAQAVDRVDEARAELAIRGLTV